MIAMKIPHKCYLSRLFLLIALFLIAQSISASERITYWEDANTVFDQGVILYRNNEFESAKEKFEGMLNTGRTHQMTTAAILMAAKSCEKLGDYEKCISYSQLLLDRFPISSYDDDAHFYLGLCRYRQGNLEEALRHLHKPR